MFSCYYTSRNCKYFFDGECYENVTSLNNATECESVLAGYLLNARCYYNEPRNCTVGYYERCTCYPHRSTTYNNYTCLNIDGLYRNGHCYYQQFNCRMYSVNGQCYSRVTSLSLT